jgi:hypothetical protein
MQLFIRAVVTGFGLAFGAAIFRKVARELGLDDDSEKPARETVSSTPVT